ARCQVPVLHRRAFHDDERRPDARVEIQRTQEHGDDQAGDEGVSSESFPETRRPIVLVSVPPHRVGHASSAKGPPTINPRRRAHKSKVAIARRTGYATLWIGTGSLVSAKSSV